MRKMNVREWRGRLILLSMSCVLMLLAAELACRVWRGPAFLVHWPNLVLLEGEMDRAKTKCRFLPEPTLGYVPEPNCVGEDHSHDPTGLRVTPASPDDQSLGKPILVTGDSYAYSSEVRDNETWAAYLQEMVHHRVDNGGVSGYGLDQSVLRTESLARQIKPSLIVLSFIADDLQRATMRRLFGSNKPYFSVTGDQLELHNSPVIQERITWDRLPFWQRWFGWSMLLDKFMRHYGDYYRWFWQDAEGDWPGTGETLACPLMKRVAALGIPTLVVAQYRPHLWQYDAQWVAEQRRLSQLVLRCAASEGLQTYDSFDLIDGVVRLHGVQSLYGDWHHNAAGNKLVAEGISRALNEFNLLP